MKTPRSLIALLLCVPGTLHLAAADARRPGAAPSHFYVTSAGSALVEHGLAEAAPTGAAAAEFKTLRFPECGFVPMKPARHRSRGSTRTDRCISAE